MRTCCRLLATTLLWGCYSTQAPIPVSTAGGVDPAASPIEPVAGCGGASGTAPSDGAEASCREANPVVTQSPTDPRATTAARALLAFLYEHKGRSVLVAQQEADWSTTEQGNRIRDITSILPAIRGMDLADYIRVQDDPIPATLARWKSSRQVPQFSWHVQAPGLAESTFAGTKADVAVDEIVVEGSPLNRDWTAKLDALAERLRLLQGAGIPVLFRPLHEMNGGWFWWSKRGCDAYVNLWRYTYDYLVNVKDIHNLLWVWSAWDVLKDSCWFPGRAFVDVLAAENYQDDVLGDGGKRPPDDLNYDALAKSFHSVQNVAPELPVALGEADLVPDPRECLARNISYAWTLPWFGTHIKKNSNDWLTVVYTRPESIGAGKLPYFE